MSKENRNTPEAASAPTKTRRRRRAPSDDDIKMHVRMSRSEHDEFAAEAERRGVTVRQLVRARLLPSNGTLGAERGTLIQQLTLISTYGSDVMEPALKAMSMCPADAFTHMELISTAVMVAYEAGRRAAPSP